MPMDIDKATERLKKTYKKVSPTMARQFVKVWNTTYERTKSEKRAFQNAYSAVKRRGTKRKNEGKKPQTKKAMMTLAASYEEAADNVAEFTGGTAKVWGEEALLIEDAGPGINIHWQFGGENMEIWVGSVHPSDLSRWMEVKLNWVSNNPDVTNMDVQQAADNPELFANFVAAMLQTQGIASRASGYKVQVAGKRNVVKATEILLSSSARKAVQRYFGSDADGEDTTIVNPVTDGEEVMVTDVPPDDEPPVFESDNADTSVPDESSEDDEGIPESQDDDEDDEGIPEDSNDGDEDSDMGEGISEDSDDDEDDISEDQDEDEGISEDSGDEDEGVSEDDEGDISEDDDEGIPEEEIDEDNIEQSQKDTSPEDDKSDDDSGDDEMSDDGDDGDDEDEDSPIEINVVDDEDDGEDDDEDEDIGNENEEDDEVIDGELDDSPVTTTKDGKHIHIHVHSSAVTTAGIRDVVNYITNMNIPGVNTLTLAVFSGVMAVAIASEAVVGVVKFGRLFNEHNALKNIIDRCVADAKMRTDASGVSTIKNGVVTLDRKYVVRLASWFAALSPREREEFKTDMLREAVRAKIIDHKDYKDIVNGTYNLNMLSKIRSNVISMIRKIYVPDYNHSYEVKPLSKKELDKLNKIEMMEYYNDYGKYRWDDPRNKDITEEEMDDYIDEYGKRHPFDRRVKSVRGVNLHQSHDAQVMYDLIVEHGETELASMLSKPHPNLDGVGKLIGKLMQSLSNRDREIVRRGLISIDIRASDFSDADLHGLDLSGINFEDVDFERANLRNAILIGCNLGHANLDHADIRGAKIDIPDTASTHNTRI